MWFSRIGALQDEFEGKLPIPAYAGMKAFHEGMAKSFSFHPQHDQLANGTERNIEDGRAMVAVNCWFRDESECLKMWEAYVPNGSGVAIRSTLKRLSQSFQLGPLPSSIARVKYVDFATFDMDIKAANDGFERAKLKNVTYQHEKEVRIITFNSLHHGTLNPDGSEITEYQKTGPGLFDPDRKGFYVKCSLPELVQSVHISPQAPPHMRLLVSRLMNTYRLFVNVI